jgi:uncharacterized protein (TIGR03382 family)
MMFLLSGLALGQDVDLSTCPPLDESILLLRTEGSPLGYECTLAADGAREALIEASVEGEFRERVTRALAVLRLRELDEAIEPAEARAFQPADVRLLNDGIHAHRGRKSPAPEHEAVFEKMDWYQPNPQFTNGLLTDQDKANIEILKNPPPASLAPSAADAMASADEALDPGPRGPCSCSSAGSALPLLGLIGLLILARRADPGPSARTGRAASPPRG